MGRSHQVTVDIALPPEQAEAALYQAFLAAGLSHVRGGAGRMSGAVPTTFLSWGEDVTGVTSYGAHGATVVVRSESTLPTALVDYGRNRKNVERVVEALRPLVPVVTV